MMQRTAGLQPCFQRRKMILIIPFPARGGWSQVHRVEMAPFRPGEGHWGACLIFHSVVCIAPDPSSRPFPFLRGLFFLLPSQSRSSGSGAGAGAGGVWAPKPRTWFPWKTTMDGSCNDPGVLTELSRNSNGFLGARRVPELSYSFQSVGLRLREIFC